MRKEWTREKCIQALNEYIVKNHRLPPSNATVPGVPSSPIFISRVGQTYQQYAILMNQWLCGYREGGSGKPCYGVQGAEIAENKRRFAADLASASQQLYRLENDIQGQSGTFSQWLRIAHELNEDFERPYAEVVNEICDAVRYVDHQYGREIAQQLYNSNRIILASEIREAAQYLSLGGRFENLAELARVGFLWEKPARMKCAVRLLL